MVEEEPQRIGAGLGAAVGAAFDDGPFDVRSAEIEPQVATRRRRVGHAAQDSDVTRV